MTTSDDIFRTNGAAGVIRAVNSEQIQAAIKDANNASWVPADDIYGNLKSLQSAVAILLLGNPSDAEKARLGAIQADINGLIADVSPSTVTGDRQGLIRITVRHKDNQMREGYFAVLVSKPIARPKPVKKRFNGPNAFSYSSLGWPDAEWYPSVVLPVASLPDPQDEDSGTESAEPC